MGKKRRVGDSYICLYLIKIFIVSNRMPDRWLDRQFLSIVACLLDSAHLLQLPFGFYKFFIYFVLNNLLNAMKKIAMNRDIIRQYAIFWNLTLNLFLVHVVEKNSKYMHLDQTWILGLSHRSSGLNFLSYLHLKPKSSSEIRQK